MKLKNLIILLTICLFFVYGVAVGHLRIFPFKQINSVRNFVENRIRPEPVEIRYSESVIVRNTFLNRLLIKKIQLGPDIGYGGGLSTAGNMLYITANKGEIYAYDLNTFSERRHDISRVPMNLDDFLASGHQNRNEFRLMWFRVNGVLTQAVDDVTQEFYAVHNGYDKSRDCITYNVSKTTLRINDDNTVSQLDDWETIFSAEPCIDPEPEFWLSAVPYSGHISGGKIIEYDDDHLLVSIGDYNHHGMANTRLYAQDMENPYGKFVLVNKYSGDWSVFAYGNRNPSGLFRDSEGIIWSAENGPEAGDELNIITEGANYGWPMVSYGIWYDTSYDLHGDAKHGYHSGYTEPVYAWIPAIAPSNLIRVEGEKFEHWSGDLLVGAMRDRSLRRLRIDSNNRVAYDETIPLEQRVRDITVLQDGKIAVLTDDSFLLIIDDGGPVFRRMDDEIFERIINLDRFDGFVTTAGERLALPDYMTGADAIFINKCGSCHGMSPGPNVGPHLGDLFSREIGREENYPYSDVLRMDTRTWSPELLRSYLMTPESQFLNSRMPKVNLTSAETDSVIAYIKEYE